MSVLQRVVKPTTHRGKKIQLKKEPQLIEGTKKALFFKGRKTSEAVRGVLKDLCQLKKPDAMLFSRKNDITIFENPNEVENFCRRHDCGLFMMGSHSKKRPNNIVIGRSFNNAILDMIELRIDSYEGFQAFATPKVTFGIKPCLVFNGPMWEQSAELRDLKSLFIDFFHRDTVDAVSLQGVEHTLSFNISSNGSILFRSYRVLFKKSGDKVPRVELEEIGPRIDFTLGRTKLPSEDLMKEACKKPKEVTISKTKNINTDNLGQKQGRIHTGKQNIDKIQTRRTRGFKENAGERRAEKRKALSDNNNVKDKRVKQ